MTVVLPIQTVIGNEKWTKIWSGDWIPSSPHTTHILAIQYALYLREGQNNHIQRKIWVRVSKKIADKLKNQLKWRKSTSFTYNRYDTNKLRSVILLNGIIKKNRNVKCCIPFDGTRHHIFETKNLWRSHNVHYFSTNSMCSESFY